MFGLRIIGFAVLIFVAAFVAYGFFRTWKTKQAPEQKVFLSGRVPNPLPHGFYKGKVSGYAGAWRGKKFDAFAKTGINLFHRNGSDQEIYPFRTYVAKGLQDEQLDVLKIDYDIPGNPFWLRRILDEIVEVATAKYLGKVHLRLIPGIPFTFAYFWLEG